MATANRYRGLLFMWRKPTPRGRYVVQADPDSPRGLRLSSLLEPDPDSPTFQFSFSFCPASCCKFYQCNVILFRVEANKFMLPLFPYEENQKSVTNINTKANKFSLSLFPAKKKIKSLLRILIQKETPEIESKRQH
jgi:hypothetical protein